jgi:hypothetical protein
MPIPDIVLLRTQRWSGVVVSPVTVAQADTSDHWPGDQAPTGGGCCNETLCMSARGCIAWPWHRVDGRRMRKLRKLLVHSTTVVGGNKGFFASPDDHNDIGSSITAYNHGDCSGSTGHHTAWGPHCVTQGVRDRQRWPGQTLDASMLRSASW